MAGKAERRPPVELTNLDAHASGALQDRDVPLGAVVDDAHLPARAKDAHGLTKRLGAFVVAGDVAQGQAAEHHVERLGRKGEIPCVGIDDVDTLADALEHRVALGGCPAIARLVAQPPDIDSGRTAPGEATGRRDEDGAPAAADVEHVLVASQAEVVEQLLPDRSLARTCGVEVARGDAGHGHGRHLRHSADKALVSSPRPAVTSQQAGSDEDEERNAEVPSIDAVAGSISLHLTECANHRGRPSTTISTELAAQGR